jgi:hypothetical protein
MKTSQLAAVAAAFIAVGTLVSPRATAQTATTPTIPVGDITAYPTVVQTGTKPTLTWSINYPSIVEEFVTITPPATVTPKENLVCDVRILGLGVTSQNSSGLITYWRTRGQWRINGSSSWSDLYDGKQTDTVVQQQGLVRTSVAVTKGRGMTFAGQYYNGSSWATLYSSIDGTNNVRALINGQTCPGNIPDYNAPSLESFLKPYLDSSKKVRIGPMDVIIIMELTHTDTSNVGYDLQDLVLLCTFRKP